MIADVPDCLVKVLLGVRDVLPVRLMGRVQRGLQAQARMEKVTDDAGERVLADLRRVCLSGLRYRQPGGDGRLPARVDRDQAIEPIQAQDATDDPGRRHQPQLCTAGNRPLVGAHQGLRASVITRGRGGHIHDQRRGTTVDERQQLLTDRASIKPVNVVRGMPAASRRPGVLPTPPGSRPQAH